MFAMNASTSNGSVFVPMNISHNMTHNISQHLNSTNVTSFVLHATTQTTSTFQSIFILAMLANSFLYISPLGMVIKALREQLYMKDLTAWWAPTYLIFAQSYLWSCYGYCTGLTDLARFNAVGSILCMIYLGTVAKSVQPREIVEPLVLISVIVLVVFSLGVLTISSDCSLSFARAATLFNIGMILAPMRDAAGVIQTGSLDQFPLAITVSSFFSSLLWARYAMLVHDRYYIIPNMFGAVFCGAELIVIYWTIRCGGCGFERKPCETEHQPLMPRTRGKTKMSDCRSLFSFLGYGDRAPTSKTRRLDEVDTNRLGSLWRGYSGKFTEAAGSASEPWTNMPLSSSGGGQATYNSMGPGAQSVQKSPFSAFDAEVRDECCEDPDLEPAEDLNSVMDQFAFLDGETYRECNLASLNSAFSTQGGAGHREPNHGLDCIL